MTTIAQRLPDDVDALKALVLEREAHIAERDLRIAERDERIAKLEHRCALLEKAHFGPRSEKRPATEGEPDDPRQGCFVFPEILEAAQRVADQTGASGTVELESPKRKDKDKGAGKRRRRRKGGRQRFPSDAPRVRTTYKLPEEDRSCCGQPMESIGEDVTEQLERIEMTVVSEVARTKYACRCCGIGVKTAPGPARPIDKGLLGTGFLAHVATERFLHHMPYHRLEKKYAAEGLAITRSVLCRSMLRIAELLAPIAEQMKREVLASPLIQTDDTPVRIQAAQGGGPRRGHAWIYKDLAGRHVYDFTESRSRDGPLAFLGDYGGSIQADAYPGYDIFFTSGRATEVGCWAHARRRFVEAEATEPELAQQAVAEIRELYAIEARCKQQGLDAEAVREVRQREARPILERLRDELTVWQGQVLDKSPMGTAIRYAQGQWVALTRYLEDGATPIDNNAAENGLRGIAVGRKNWLFVGHEEAGKKGAVLLSLIKTCEVIGVDPRAYLTDVLTRIAVCSDVEQLTPHGWQQHFAAEVNGRRQAVLDALAGR